MEAGRGVRAPEGGGWIGGGLSLWAALRIGCGIGEDTSRQSLEAPPG